MINQDLINYINRVRAEGKTDQQIEEDLLKVGWAQTDIDEAFGIKSNAILNAPNLNPTASQKTPITKITIIAIVVILLAGGAFGYYKYVYNKPAKTTSSNNQITPTPASSPTATNNILPSPTPTQTPSTESPTHSAEKPLVNNSLTVSKNIFVIRDDGTLITPQGQVQLFEVAKKFYSLSPDKKDTYDFLTLYNAFHDPISGAENHASLSNNVKGIASNAYPSNVPGIPSKLLGINYLNDAFGSAYVSSEEFIKNNLFVLDHETGHQWLAYVGKDEGILAKPQYYHYSEFFKNVFTRDSKETADVMNQGSFWRDNGDGTMSIANDIQPGFSNFSLYLMGFMPASEVTDLQIFVPNNPIPNHPTYKDINNVPFTFKTIAMKTIIAKYGEREPSYLNSQKDFNMAYILVIKKGQEEVEYNPYLKIVGWIAKYFPDEWNYITYGKSTINKGL